MNYSVKSFNFSIRSGLYPPASLFMISKERCNLCMNHASLDRESLDRVWWTSTTWIQRLHHNNQWSQLVVPFVKWGEEFCYFDCNISILVIVDRPLAVVLFPMVPMSCFATKKYKNIYGHTRHFQEWVGRLHKNIISMFCMTDWVWTLSLS